MTSPIALPAAGTYFPFIVDNVLTSSVYISAPVTAAPFDSSPTLERLREEVVMAVPSLTCRVPVGSQQQAVLDAPDSASLSHCQFCFLSPSACNGRTLTGGS